MLLLMEVGEGVLKVPREVQHIYVISYLLYQKLHSCLARAVHVFCCNVLLSVIDMLLAALA